MRPNAQPACPICGGLLIEYDLILTGWNGALSDVGTDEVGMMCEECGWVKDDD